MKCAYIYTHQGYTDIILCIGLVFYNLKLYDKVILVIHYRVREFINYIFRSENNIIIHYYKYKKGRSRRFLKTIHNNNLYVSNEYTIDYLIYGDYGFNGHNPQNIVLGGYGYFYNHYGIDNNIAIDYFLIKRDNELETQKYNELINNIGNEYIIINEDIKRNYIIDKTKINNGLKLFNINRSSNLVFDMIKIIENAKEIHLISTFWSLIIYLLQKKYNMFNNIKIFFHDYVRPGYYKHLYKGNNWIIIN
jgi:hypothetical protein